MSSFEFQQGFSRNRGGEGEEAAETSERSTELFGTSVESPRRVSITAVIFVLLAISCAVLGFVHVGWLLGGVSGCAAVAVVFFWQGSRQHRFHFTERGIEFESFLLPYEEILEVFISQKYQGKVNFPIVLLTADRFETLPARLSIPSETLYNFLLSQPRGERPLTDVPEAFANFLRHQRALYPRDVYVYRARSSKSRTLGWNWGMLLGVGLILAGFLYFAITLVLGMQRGGGYFVGGWIAVGSGAFIYLIGTLARNPGRNQSIANWKKSLMIVSPGGLALSLAGVQGEVRWAELVDLTWKLGRSMTLRLQGVDLVVPDLFHWPIEHVARVSQYYFSQSR